MKYVAGFQVEGKLEDLMGLHSHEHLEIFYFHDGECNFQINNQIIPMEQGDLLLIDRLVVHKAFVDFDYHYSRSVLHFSIDWLLPVLQALGKESLLDLFKSKNGFLYRFKDKAVLEDINYHFSNLADNTYHTDLQNQLSLMQMLLNIENSDRFTAIEQPVKDQEKVARVGEVINYMANNFQEKLSISSIARAVNLSESYLSHLFKDFTGMSVINFLMSYRLTQSKYLLTLYPNLSVKEVSEQCGFESNAHFSRFFKKHTGMAPLNYRQKHEM